MQNIKFVVAPHQATRIIHDCKEGLFIGLAVTIGVGEAYDAALVGLVTE